MIDLLPLALALLTPAAAHQEAAGNVQVVDATTGEPVAGAEVLGVREIEVPVFGVTWSEARDVTDAEGWATLPPVTSKQEPPAFGCSTTWGGPWRGSTWACALAAGTPPTWRAP